MGPFAQLAQMSRRCTFLRRSLRELHVELLVAEQPSAWQEVAEPRSSEQQAYELGLFSPEEHRHPSHTDR
jgi:hypothetical protein